MRDYYDSENLADTALIQSALSDFNSLPANASDIRPLLTEGGAYSYANGGQVLSSQDHSDRVQVARMMVPHAIAMTVHLLNHAATRF